MKGAYGGKFIYDSLHEILIFSGRTKDEKTMEWKKEEGKRAFTFNWKYDGAS